MKIKLWHGDCLKLMKKIPDNSIDSIVTDPPYGLGFMGKSWDKVLPPTEIWQECMRVLKPAGYIVAMSASRTYHRLAVQLEDLGMICHPMIGWIYGSGFPKATDLSKQFDKAAGVKPLEIKPAKGVGFMNDSKDGYNTTKNQIVMPEATTDNAKKWNGYKYGLQALKPALEPIAVFQKPWKCKGVKKMTDNVEKYGVGAFNIDACRVGLNGEKIINGGEKIINGGEKIINGGGNNIQFNTSGNGTLQEKHYKSKLKQTINTTGRHPANLLHDGSEVVEKVFLEQGGIRKYGDLNNITGLGDGNIYGKSKPRHCFNKGDSGSASRFFNKLPITDLDAPFLYTAKPSKKERGENNNHPTVKPIALMNWLVKLVTPEGGTILDPFMGSGTTGIAAKEFNFIGIEMNKEYFNIAKERIKNA